VNFKSAHVAGVTRIREKRLLRVIFCASLSLKLLHVFNILFTALAVEIKNLHGF
jgi:hypothetical protein